MNASGGMDPEYAALIHSGRVSAATRTVLLARMEISDEPAAGTGLSSDAKRTLQRLAECVVPMTGRSIDFATLIDIRLATGTGKGWRYSELPSDLAAYCAAIVTIDRYSLGKFRSNFLDLPPGEQMHALTLIQHGELDGGSSESEDDSPALDAAQMQRWFEDLRGDVVGIYISHPVTLAQLGYSGIADGANSEALSGFVELGPDKVEPWEPQARGTSE